MRLGVGLRLGGARALASLYGPELNPNPEFHGQPPYVVTGEGATHVVTFSDGAMRYQSDTTSPVLRVRIFGILAVGERYRIEAITSAYSSGVLQLGGIDPNSAGADISAGIGSLIVEGVATFSDLSLLRKSANVDTTLARLSIRKVL